MNKLFFKLLVLIVISSCNGQSNPKFKKDTLNLKKLSIDFDTESFFDVSVELLDEYIIEAYEYNIKGNIEAYEYQHEISSSADKLAVLDNLYFSKIGILTTPENEFMVLYAKNANTDSIFYKKMIPILNTLYGTPIKKDSTNSTARENLFAKGTRLTWFDKNRVIQIYSRKKINPFSKEESFQFTLFIANKKFDTQLRGNLNRGPWGNFD